MGKKFKPQPQQPPLTIPESEKVKEEKKDESKPIEKTKKKKGKN